jgi:hypothetical protein
VGQSIIATVEPHETVVLKTIRELGLERPVIFNKGAVMILPPGINKATGLAVALAELGLSARNVVAAGDADERPRAPRCRGIFGCVANAIATLKAAADRVTTAPRGEGVLEVIDDLIESDLRRSPPAARAAARAPGKDAKGDDFCLAAAADLAPRDGAHKTGKSKLVRGLLGRFARWANQFCVIDGRGLYLDFEPAARIRHARAPTGPARGLQRPRKTRPARGGVPRGDRAAAAPGVLRELRPGAGSAPRENRTPPLAGGR